MGNLFNICFGGNVLILSLDWYDSSEYMNVDILIVLTAANQNQNQNLISVISNRLCYVSFIRNNSDIHSLKRWMDIYLHDDEELKLHVSIMF